MKILVCEDDLMTQKAIAHKLKQDSYEIVIASNGKEAIDIISKGEIDLLLSDIHMPQLTGLELVEYVRNTLKNNMPIIILTRVGLEETVLKAFEIGADDYITKPFNPDELSLRVKKQILRMG